jgi:hypothetical protein
MESARLLLEVVAGVVPESTEPKFTRRWGITTAEWESSDDQMGLLAERTGQAQGYAQLLMLQPQRLNWVRLDWIWL